MRLADCCLQTSSGEPVSWVVTKGGTTYTYSGTWWFSIGANLASYGFGSSGYSYFSSDDGIWGAANGVLNGDQGVCSSKPSACPSAYDLRSTGGWGVQNYDNGDSTCGTFYESGVANTGDSRMITEMYLVSGSGVTLSPSATSGTPKSPAECTLESRSDSADGASTWPCC
jgi:hypothetical protein